MVKEILTNLRDDKSVYIQSASGLSIIQIAYFKPDKFDDAIINLRYFGSVSKDNFKYSGFRFDVKGFYEFYSHLQDLLNPDSTQLMYTKIDANDERINLTRSDNGISVYKYVSKTLQERNDPLWEFYIDRDAANEFIEHLRNMLVLIATQVDMSEEV